MKLIIAGSRSVQASPEEIKALLDHFGASRLQVKSVTI